MRPLEPRQGGRVGRQLPGVHGPAAAKRPASNQNPAVSGRAVGNETRMCAALSRPQTRSGSIGDGGHQVSEPIRSYRTAG